MSSSLELNVKNLTKNGSRVANSIEHLVNIHRFALDYLGLNLYPFQIIMLYMMNIMYSTCFICARGLSKSYMTAIFLVCKAILYPNSLIVVSCSTKEQARNLIKEKIAKELCSQSRMLKREISKVVIGTNETVIYFHNGSTIQAVNASQNTRGKFSYHFTFYNKYCII